MHAHVADMRGEAASGAADPTDNWLHGLPSLVLELEQLFLQKFYLGITSVLGRYLPEAARPRWGRRGAAWTLFIYVRGVR